MHRIATVIGISSVLVGLAGVSTAAVQASSSGASYKACATKSGVLSVESHGKCAKHTKKVTIAAKGPAGPRGKTGPQGPGVIFTSVDEGDSNEGSGPTVATGIAGVTVTPTCQGNADSYVQIAGSGVLDVRGALNVVANSGDGGYGNFGPLSGGETGLTPGADAIVTPETVTGSSPLVFRAFSGATMQTAVSGLITVTKGAASFELEITIASAPNVCDASAAVTPMTTAAGSS